MNSNLPSASQVLGAHTSRLSFPYGFKRQWYSIGLKQVCGYKEQFFSNALRFHSDEFIGQLSMTDAESAEGGQGSAMFRTSECINILNMVKNLSSFLCNSDAHLFKGIWNSVGLQTLQGLLQCLMFVNCYQKTTTKNTNFTAK